MAIIGAILFIAGAIVVAAIYAVGFAVLSFGLATLAVFYYLGAFWGVAWLAFWVAVFFLGRRLKKRTKLALSSNHCSR